MQQVYKFWTATVGERNRWQLVDRGIIGDPRTLDPNTYLQDNSWFFITHDDYVPEWHHQQYTRGCRFTARKPNSTLIRRLIEMWADDEPALQKTEVVAISQAGQLQVWTVRQSEDERHQTLTHLNLNPSGVRFVRDHERDGIFHANHSRLDAYVQNHKGEMYENIRIAEADGMPHDRAEDGQRFLDEVEGHLNAIGARDALAEASQDHSLNVIDLHHQRAHNVVTILAQHIPERLAAIRADESLPQVLTIISGRGNGSREFGQSPVRSAVIAYLDSHYPAYRPVSRGGAFELSAIDNDLPELTQALSRL